MGDEKIPIALGVHHTLTTSAVTHQNTPLHASQGRYCTVASLMLFAETHCLKSATSYSGFQHLYRVLIRRLSAPYFTITVPKSF
jgi:hypothetical protein